MIPPLVFLGLVVFSGYALLLTLVVLAEEEGLVRCAPAGARPAHDPSSRVSWVSCFLRVCFVAYFGSFSGGRGIRTPGPDSPGQRFSRPPHSTTLPFLRRKNNKYFTFRKTEPSKSVFKTSHRTGPDTVPKSYIPPCSSVK